MEQTTAVSQQGIYVAGAALGWIGLSVFALILWRLLPAHDPYVVVTFDAFAWISVSASPWKVG